MTIANMAVMYKRLSSVTKSNHKAIQVVNQKIPNYTENLIVSKQWSKDRKENVQSY